MVKNPSFWSRLNVLSWFGADQETHRRADRKRTRVARRLPFESLEERDLLTVVVNLTTTNIFQDVPAIVIQGSGFDPIVSHNTVQFNDGVGTVTAATDSELTVEFSTPPSEAGVLTVIVSTLTENSGSAVQVATIVPTVTASAVALAANATSITIIGTGFDTQFANNVVSFDNGAAGTATAATATSLTVSITTPPTAAGPLTAEVITNSVSSGANVQVAKIVPVVTSSSAVLAADATTMTIDGFGFSLTASNNTVDFDGKAVGTVTGATATTLTITLSTPPKVAGDLFAIVRTNGVSSAGAVQVASVKPVETASTSSLAANASTIVIDGFGFDSIAGNNTVAFNDNAVGSVTSATATQLTITFSTKPTKAGVLNATVTTNGVAATTAQVATVIPVVTSRTINVAANATTVTINGFGFDSTIGNNAVTLNNGATGTVSAASATSLTVTFTAQPTSAGTLTAFVTTNSAVSGSGVQIATVTPVITSSTTDMSANIGTVTINGFGFDSIDSNNTVVFNNGAIGNVSTASNTSLTVTFTAKPATAGSLTAVVTSAGVGSGTAVQIKNITPVVTSSTANRGANANTIVINGFGFSPVLANNVVSFTDSAVGTVTAATPTSITVTYSTKPVTAGSMSAGVTTNSVSSGAQVQVATITPVVTPNASNIIPVSDNWVIITGYGFDTTLLNNSVTLLGGAVGSVTEATATAIKVTFSTKPTKAGLLKATVTTNTLSSDADVTVASVSPVVLANNGAKIASNATTVIVVGIGFDTTAANNTIVFDSGAVGTVSSATATALTVSLSSTPTSGNLNATVTTNGISNGSTVRVGTVRPVVTSSAATLAATSNSITIRGTGFSTTAADNTVVFNNGAEGTVTSASATELSVAFLTNKKPTSAGSLTAIVTSKGVASNSAIQVATVAPVITSRISNLSPDATTVTINGFGFASALLGNTVIFNNGAEGSVTTASATALTVTFSKKPKTAGSLTATVTSNSIASVSANVQIASVIPLLLANSDYTLGVNAATLIINGLGFDLTAANNIVLFENGAIGTVSAATGTSLTVDLGTAPTAGGNMNAFVTTNGIGSGTAIQVAKIAPLVTSVTPDLAITATAITITGVGFDTTAANNTVVFNNGAVGSVSAATATSLTVTISTQPTSVGALTAVVSTNGVSSASPVQVASVIPVITSSTSSLAADTTTLMINGFGFSTNASENTVSFNNNAVGTVTSATATALSVTFTTNSSAVGTLNARVTTNSRQSVNTQVATVIPSVSLSSDPLVANASSIVIAGFGFSTTASDNTVLFNNGAVGTVDTATATSLTVLFSTKPTGVGSLTAVVTTSGNDSSSAVQVASVKPSVTSSTTGLAATSNTVLIHGFGFSTTAADNTVVFNDGAEGTVTIATATELTVTFSTNKKPASAGILTAVVTTSSLTSGTAVQVATVTPVSTENTANLAADASTLTINGFGFEPTASLNTVEFNKDAIGVVTAATTTSLTVAFTTKPRTGGSLTVTVRSNGVASDTANQVSTVIPVVVANSSLKLSANSDTFLINGSGFDPIAGNNLVTLNNGAIGDVTAATATSLTVTYSTKPTSAGSLTAIVSTNNAGSGSAIQVATVAPVITSSTTNIAANATTRIISGFGFDTVLANNTVVLSSGAEGSVTAATPTQLTVTFADNKSPAVGNLTAMVTSNSVTSGTAIQIASVIPVVTSSAASLGSNASTVDINGFGFDTTASRNVVTFNNGAVGSVTSATATRLTVTFTTKPAAVGSLTASVSTNSISSAAVLQVANVVGVITSSSANLGVNDTTFTINGFGFDTTASNNAVTLSSGTGTVTAATATTLTVTFGVKPTAGNLTATVITNTVSSGSPIQVATMKPIVTSSSSNLNTNATTVTISGFGFDTTPANNTVILSNGAEGTVTAATATLLTVTFADNRKPAAGNLTAQVTTNSISSGTAVQIASAIPMVTSSTAGLGISSSTIEINGFGFDTVASHNTVTFNNGAIGTVSTATATRLTVTFGTKPSSVGSLTATVTTNSIANGSALQVANVIGVITSSSTSRGADESTLTINGFGFDATASNNTVTLSNDAIGTVTAATATTLTVTLSTRPKVGNLTATVVTRSVSSGTPVQVASIKPVVTSNTSNVGINADNVTISGFGFDIVATNNTVEFNLGGVGTVTAATATSLTVRFSTRPTSLGNLTAIVRTNSVSSGSALQVAKIVPVVTSGTANLALTSTTLIVNGFGFDSATPGNNTVELNNGAVGTVTAATATALTVTFSGTLTAGNLTAIVTRGGVSSGNAVQVASIKPIATSSSSELLASLATLTIAGSGFSTTAANNTLVFNNGAIGTVTASTATALTVTISTKPIAGALTAIVTTNGVSSGTAVQVALINPVVTSSTVSLALNGTSLVINGFGFSPVTASNTVTLSGGAVGAITAATATSLTINLTTKPTAVGSLTARVTANTRLSEAGVQVAQLVANVVAPTVTVNTSATQAADVSTVTIAGTNFSTTAANNLVKFSNGGVGTVTSATATSLTVEFTTKPKAGILTAIVTSSGVPSGIAVQVASVTPVVTISTTNRAASESTLTISGIGFDTTASNNTVVLSNGAAGSVTAATSTTLTVTLSSRPTSAGNMTVVVTTNTKSSGATVQVARVLPAVTLNAASLAINATSIVISGFAFDTVAANNTVTFNNGAIGTVTSSTATSLTVSIDTRPTSLGNLTATVTTNSISSGTAVQVATARPVVTTSSSNQGGDVATITIAGDGFDTTAANNTVTFSNGAIGTVTSAMLSAITVSLTTKPAAGSLTAVVTTNGVNSGTAVQVANVVPVITTSTAGIATSASSITINGFGFDTTPSRNTVTFNNSATGTVVASTSTTLTVNFVVKPRAVGSLTAQVTTNSVSNGSAVQVAAVVPTITSSTTNLTATQDTITIAGVGFDATAANNTITFNLNAIGRITAATATSLTVLFTTRPTTLGNLTAVVTTNSVSSGDPIQVGAVRPTVTAATTSLALTANTMVISGTRFDTTAANNTVVFSNGAVGTVSSATATSLSITFSTRATAGNLTAVVTTNGVSTGTAIQVATLAPIVTLSTTGIAANVTSVTIAGSGFDTTASRNTVAFNNGAIGTVSSATATSLTVSFLIKPASAGSLTAIVTVNGATSGTAIQIASVSPVVTPSSTNLSSGAASIVIAGLGFDPSISRNTVIFNNGAVGVVTAATATSLTVRIDTKPTSVGSLTAVVTTNSISSGSATQVATVIPSVTASTTAITASSTTLTIRGFGFSTTAGNNTVVFNNGAVGIVSVATATTLTVTLSTGPTAGNLTAIVTTNSLSSGSAIQVATLAPTVTVNATNLSADATTVVIAGTGFDTTAANNRVVFNNGAVGTVASATATALTVTFGTRPASGSLTALVTTNGVISPAAVQVAAVRPLVTASTTNLARTADTIVINGFGFSTTASSNTIVFSNGARGTVTAATGTRLTVQFTTKTTITGSLTAIITSNAIGSGTAVQVANMT